MLVWIWEGARLVNEAMTHCKTQVNTVKCVKGQRTRKLHPEQRKLNYTKTKAGQECFTDKDVIRSGDWGTWFSVGVQGVHISCSAQKKQSTQDDSQCWHDRAFPLRISFKCSKSAPSYWLAQHDRRNWLKRWDTWVGWLDFSLAVHWRSLKLHSGHGVGHRCPSVSETGVGWGISVSTGLWHGQGRRLWHVSKCGLRKT